MSALAINEPFLRSLIILIALLNETCDTNLVQFSVVLKHSLYFFVD